MKPSIRVVGALILAACSGGGGGNGGGGSHSGLEDVNRDGRVVVLAFGDSITLGVGDGPRPSDTPAGSGGYPVRLQNALGVTVINDGSSGERTSDGLPRLQRDVADTRPDYAILVEGTNDLLGHESSTRAADNMRSMIHSVHAAGAVPILGTIPPLCCDIENDHPRSATVTYNDQLRAVAASEAVTLVDFYAAFAGGSGAAYDAGRGLIHQPEGIHPTSRGYDVMSEAARQALAGR
jgi:lysophospholipase L1-like esterase